MKEMKVLFESRRGEDIPISVQVTGNRILDRTVGIFEDGQLLVNGMPVPLPDQDHQRIIGSEWAFQSSDAYAAIAVSDGLVCQVLVFSLLTGGRAIIDCGPDHMSDMWFLSAEGPLAGSPIKSEHVRSRMNELLCIRNNGRTGIADCAKLLPNRKCRPLRTYSFPFYNRPNIMGLEEVFTYTVTDDMGLLIELKSGVDRNKLLNFGYFSNEYDAFKICFDWSDKEGYKWDWSEGEEAEHIRLMLIDKETHTTRVRHFCETTLSEEPYLEKLLKSAALVLSWHPALAGERYHTYEVLGEDFAKGTRPRLRL